MSTESKKKQQLPKWFDGDVYSEGDFVVNPFSGQEYELTAEELSMYDLIIGLQMVIDTLYAGDLLNPDTAYLQKDMAKGLRWFRSANPQAYMVLLD